MLTILRIDHAFIVYLRIIFLDDQRNYKTNEMKNIFTKPVFRITSVFLSVLVITLSACKKDNNGNAELINQIKSITYLTENYPPLNYEQEGELHGVSVDILEALFGKMNVNLSRNDVTLKNWADAYQQTLNEEHTMLFSTARLPARESLFKWVGPIAPEKNIVVGLTASNITINSTSDLNNHTVGVIEDYAAILILPGDHHVDEAQPRLRREPAAIGDANTSERLGAETQPERPAR